MKRNAITRIIIWSIVLVLLVGILCSAVVFNRRPINRISEIEHEAVPVTTPSMHTAPHQGNIYLNPQAIQDIKIEWVAGSIVIQPAEVDKIKVSESEVTDADDAMVWQVKGDTLCIAFCEDSVSVIDFPSLGINTNLSKDLTIYVPMDWTCETLEIDAASANLEVCDLSIGDVEIDTASGECDFSNCIVDEIDLDTASGDIRFAGKLNVLDCDAASASVFATLENTPSRMDMDTMSGNLDITLPEDAGFTVSMGGMTSNFSSDFETTTANGKYVCGDGSCRINVDAMSGDVTIRKHMTAIAVPETVTAP